MSALASLDLPPGELARTTVEAARALAPVLEAEAPRVDRDDGFPVESIAALHAHGLLAAALPGEAHAGLADPRSIGSLLRVLAHVGRGSLPVGRLYEGHVNALMLIGIHGTAAQRRRAAQAAAEGALFAVWNTQGAEGAQLEPAGGGWRVTGCKTFASGAGRVRHAVVTARTPDGGWQMTWIDTARQPLSLDATFWQPLGMKASASYKVDLTGARLEAHDLIGPPEAYYREPAFSAGAIRFAAVQAGGIEAVFDATRIQLRSERRTTDPHQQARVGEMAIGVAAARHWLRGAAELAAAHAAGRVDDATLIAHAHLVRSAIDAIGLRTLQLAERSVGARGLLKPAPFERLHRDLTHYLRQANPDAALAAAGAHALTREEPAHALWPT